jgi:hypothetical protein
VRRTQKLGQKNAHGQSVVDVRNVPFQQLVRLQPPHLLPQLRLASVSHGVKITQHLGQKNVNGKNVEVVLSVQPKSPQQ